MRITVTPACYHPRTPNSEPYWSSGLPLEGQHVVVSTNGVILDGVEVIKRDRRVPRSRREVGHDWVTSNGKPENDLIPWTTFTVNVLP